MGKDEWVGVNGGREVRTGGSRGGKVWEKVVNMRSKFCIERKKRKLEAEEWCRVASLS